MNPHCQLPPRGWTCSRGAGHPGSCAARRGGLRGRLLDALRGLADWLEMVP